MEQIYVCEERAELLYILGVHLKWMHKMHTNTKLWLATRRNFLRHILQLLSNAVPPSPFLSPGTDVSFGLCPIVCICFQVGVVERCRVTALSRENGVYVYVLHMQNLFRLCALAAWYRGKSLRRANYMQTMVATIIFQLPSNKIYVRKMINPSS